MTNDIQIMYDSPEAAQRVTVAGWRSRDGHFYGDNEGAARYAGCTHRACQDCGAPIKKLRMVCDECRQKCVIAKYATLPRETWDGTTPLCMFDGDEYFFDADDLHDYCADHDCTVEDLLLVICKPVYLSQINEDY
ncbi:MAG TPA: hypothetical protein VF389_02705 [Woeseiaceae bacterium]